MTRYVPARGIRRIAEPQSEPLSLTQVKAWLRIEHSDEDSLINELIHAARETAEAHTQQSLIEQSWQITYEDCAPTHIPLRHGPVTSIAHITLIDEQNASSLVDTDRYVLSADYQWLEIKDALTSHRIVIEYVCGHGSSDAHVPGDLKQAMLQHIAVMYDAREKAPPPLSSLMTYQTYRGVRL